MSTPTLKDRAYAALRSAASDPYRAVGLIAIVWLFYFFIKLYIWPEINPFKVYWFSDLWNWVFPPRRPTAQETYPYAKVIYPTYR